MLTYASFKVARKVVSLGNSMMRDERYPYDSETILIADLVYQANELWNEILSQKGQDRFEKFHENAMSRIKELKKLELIDQNSRGIRKLEWIRQK